MPSPLISKINALTERTKEFNEELHADLDELAEGYARAHSRKHQAVSVHREHLTEVHGALKETEEALTALSNAPLGSGEESKG